MIDLRKRLPFLTFYFKFKRYSKAVSPRQRNEGGVRELCRGHWDFFLLLLQKMQGIFSVPADVLD